MGGLRGCHAKWFIADFHFFLRTGASSCRFVKNSTEKLTAGIAPGGRGGYALKSRYPAVAGIPLRPEARDLLGAHL